MNRGSTKKQRLEGQQHYDELESDIDRRASERFRRKPYQSYTVDKNILIEYADTKEEIKDLRRRIEQNKKELSRLNGQIVMDSVSCGKKGKKPLGTVKITGRPVTAISRKESLLNKRIRRLEELEEELLELTIQVDEYIEMIEKSELRIIFRLYFLDDLSYPKVADQMNQRFPKRRTKYTDENIRKKFKDILKMSPYVPIKSDRV